VSPQCAGYCSNRKKASILRNIKHPEPVACTEVLEVKGAAYPRPAALLRPAQDEALQELILGQLLRTYPKYERWGVLLGGSTTQQHPPK